MKLRTADDWWALYGAIQSDIKSYIHDEPTIAVAERLDGYLDYIALKDTYLSFPGETVYGVMDSLFRDRDRRLSLILDSIWDDAPDDPIIHTWPNWEKFCDLCSESWMTAEIDGDIFDEPSRIDE